MTRQNFLEYVSNDYGPAIATKVQRRLRPVAREAFYDHAMKKLREVLKPVQTRYAKTTTTCTIDQVSGPVVRAPSRRRAA